MKWIVIGMVALLAACEGPAPMTEAEIEAATKGEPEVFRHTDGVWTLDDTTEFYLGQSQADAMKALEARCDGIVDYDGDWKRSNTFFKGCRLPDDPNVQSIRVGFNPAVDNRVFTLEVKRLGYSPDLVRARFSQKFGEKVAKDLPRRGTLRMETDDHRMFASWDDGPAGAVHLIFGLSPQGVEGLTN